MKIAYFIKKSGLVADPAVRSFLERLAAAGPEVYDVAGGLQDGTDMLVAFGGDGTFLTASRIVCQAGIPILGINLGRMGFLSDGELGSVLEPLLEGRYTIEDREMLEVRVEGAGTPAIFPYALNEVAVRRSGAGTLGVGLTLDGAELPTYWCDGLLVSTSTGSTAYSLSVGGPICPPDVDVFIIAPIAPHNLNVRPLVVSRNAKIEMTATDSKNRSVLLSVDNKDYVLPAGARIKVGCAPFALRRVALGKSSFIDALRSKLFWGEDVRNPR
ncbi:MAG: NAD(+)/NADH kinase [Bacteroidales bacterium]|nr:NAD(+)/NADH kinase [Bacteroidales bacterium]